MIITYHGATCFKVQFGDTVLAFNPISKQSKDYKPVKFGADIALISTVHVDANGVEQVAQGNKDPFIIRGPGEYEVNGITVRGYASRSDYGEEGKNNTIYVVEFENMTLCFLGMLSEREIPQSAKEAIEEIDILFTPIGGNGVLSANDAYKLSVGLEPRIVIPMMYDMKDKSDGLHHFLEEGGVEKAKPLDKLTVKQKDIAGKSVDITVLKPQ